MKLGGLPRLASQSGRRVLRHGLAPPVPTSRTAFLDLLKRKGFWLGDLEDHPVCLGVPLGRDLALGGAMQVDVGLKSLATVSLADLVDSSPQLKQAFLERAADKTAPMDSSEPALIRNAPSVRMAVLVKEDLERLPVASPVHSPSLLRRCTITACCTGVLSQLVAPVYYFSLLHRAPHFHPNCIQRASKQTHMLADAHASMACASLGR